MTAAQPAAERVQGEVTAAVERARDVIAEQADTEFPRSVAEAALAAALDVEEMAAVIVEHAPQIWSSGDIECRCGQWKTKRDGDDWKRPTHEYRGDAFRAHAAHVAGAQRAAVLGGAA